MRAGFLGRRVVKADGRVTVLAGARMWTLLIRLALDAGRAVSVESLARAMWPEEPPGDLARHRRSLT